MKHSLSTGNVGTDTSESIDPVSIDSVTKNARRIRKASTSDHGYSMSEIDTDGNIDSVANTSQSAIVVSVIVLE